MSTKLSYLLYGTSNPMLLWITLACAASAFVSRFLSLILRMQERGLAFSMSQIIPKILFLVILGGVLLFDLPHDFAMLLAAFFASSITVMAICLWNTRYQWLPATRARIEKNELCSLLHFGSPLIFSGLAYWGLVATSSISLRSLSEFSELGIYSVATSIAGVAVIFQSIFSVVWAPTVYKWISEGVDMTRVDNVARKALAAVCAIFILVGCFSWTIDYLLPSHYVSVKYLVLCAIAPPLLYTLSEITCVGIGIMRRTDLTIWVTLAALVTNVFMSIWLVPMHGAAGAVIANVLGYFVFFVARTEISARLWRNFPRARLYSHVSILLCISVAITWRGKLFPFNPLFVWLLIIPFMAVSFGSEIQLGKQLLKSFFKKIWNSY